MNLSDLHIFDRSSSLNLFFQMAALVTRSQELIQNPTQRNPVQACTKIVGKVERLIIINQMLK